jgi:leucyl/phenylalanyl-tRNA--protein transferase
MIYQLDPDYPGFPNPEEAEPDGLVAIGGDLEPLRLVNAYASGIFPWYGEGEPLLWWSLDPRMVLFPDEFRYSKSLRRVVRSGKFEVRLDARFEEVMRSCAQVDRTAQGQDSTWITEAMVEAYVRLHELGFAHSFETYCADELVGGLYGVSLGPFFFGESMFHTMTDASKVAMARLVEFCREHHFRLIDAQQQTAHLASLGARPIPRS